jgi:maleylpyruvate isomerase
MVNPMGLDPIDYLTSLDQATARLIATAQTLDEGRLAEASLLPGWTRGHVLAHVARNADAYVRLLSWAYSGVETPAYSDPAQRDAEIEAGAFRSLAEQIDDLQTSAGYFSDMVTALPDEAWAATVRSPQGESLPAAALMFARLREVEIHHVDLAASYQPSDWSDDFTGRLLQVLTRTLPGVRVRLLTDQEQALQIGPIDASAPTVSGSGQALAAWLTGRSAGAGLTVTPAGGLPAIPFWR